MVLAKIAKIAKDLEKVAKDLSVGGKGASYKAVSEGAILKAVKPLEDAHGVYSYPSSREIVQSELIRSMGDNGRERITFFERIKTVYRFVDLEDGDYIEVVSYGDGMDVGDKSVGKAMTYADKYALMKAYKIETGDDPDKEESQTIYPTDAKKAEAPKAPSGDLSSDDPATEKQKGYLKALLVRKGLNEDFVMLTKGKGIDQLTVHEAGELITSVNEMKYKGSIKEVVPNEDDLPF